MKPHINNGTLLGEAPIQKNATAPKRPKTPMGQQALPD